MDSNDVIISLNKYKTEEFETDFLNDTITYFDGKGKISKISENDYMLAGLRLHVLYNKFFIYLSPNKTNLKNVCYRQLNLSRNQATNLKNQMTGLKKNTFHICDNVKATTLKSFLIISPVEIKSEQIYLLHDDLKLALLGVHSLKFLEYQNLDNYCKIWSKSEKIFDELVVYKKKLSKLSWQERDKILIFNGLIYNFLGTIPTLDISLLIVSNNKNDSKLKDVFTNYNTAFITQIDDDETLKSTTDSYYQIQWFIHKLPALVGAPDIYTMLIDTKYHFYFMGLKCISLFGNMKKTISKTDWQSFIDIYLIKIINKLDYMNELCIKNIVIKHGKAQVNTDAYIEIMYETIHKFAKKTYGIDIPIAYIKTHFKKCSDKFETIYKNKVSYIDPLIREQIGIHRNVSQHYIMRYGRDKENLLDMGSGKLSGSYIYQKARIKNVYGVEPSIYSVELAKETAKKVHNVNFTLIHAFADKPLNLKVKFDIITFIFTIHYMIKNLDVVIDNIKKASKKGTIIIITCVNGDKILKYLSDNDRYEAQYRDDVYWGVYKFNTNDKYLFFMKDVYGLEMGSEEYLTPVNDLIEQFKQNDINLIYSNSFKDEYGKIPNAKKIHNFQYDILNLQQILIFEM